MLKRLLFDQLYPLMGHKNALVITGMRQVGKTTLMRELYAQIADNKLWFDLDNPLDSKILKKRTIQVFTATSPPKWITLNPECIFFLTRSKISQR